MLVTILQLTGHKVIVIYVYDLEKWYSKNVGPKFVSDRQEIAYILAESKIERNCSINGS